MTALISPSRSAPAVAMPRASGGSRPYSTADEAATLGGRGLPSGTFLVPDGDSGMLLEATSSDLLVRRGLGLDVPDDLSKLFLLGAG